MPEEAGKTQTEEREALEAELLERRDAALAHVVKFGDPVLKSAASPRCRTSALSCAPRRSE